MPDTRIGVPNKAVEVGEKEKEESVGTQSEPKGRSAARAIQHPFLIPCKLQIIQLSIILANF
jgi:hypothetical protein